MMSSEGTIFFASSANPSGTNTCTGAHVNVIGRVLCKAVFKIVVGIPAFFKAPSIIDASATELHSATTVHFKSLSLAIVLNI